MFVAVILLGFFFCVLLQMCAVKIVLSIIYLFDDDNNLFMEEDVTFLLVVRRWSMSYVCPSVYVALNMLTASYPGILFVKNQGPIVVAVTGDRKSETTTHSFHAVGRPP